MPIKHQNVQSLRLGDIVVEHPGFEDARWIGPTFQSKYVGPYEILHEPHRNVYTLKLFH
jgi:hypothetical protein